MAQVKIWAPSALIGTQCINILIAERDNGEGEIRNAVEFKLGGYLAIFVGGVPLGIPLPSGSGVT